jgi:hypothetical protein
MRRATLCIAGFACLVLALAAPGRAAFGGPGLAAEQGYFLDFRARNGGFAGHAFIYYGSIDASGHVVEDQYAGLYPRGHWLSLGLPFLLFPGYVSTAREDPDKDLAAVWRVRLSAARYAHLKAVVAQLRAADHWWHPAFYNCNDFVAHVALKMGLHPPLGVDSPAGFVRALRQLNRH